MKIGVIIPTKNRSVFLEQAKKMLKEQTLQPDQVEIIDDKSPYEDCDIGWRYKLGIERTKNCDFVVFWEDDDYYHSNYIKILFSLWRRNRTSLIGFRETIFYHLQIRKATIINHPNHSSMFCMGIGKGREIFDKIKDQERFVDLFLTQNLKGFYERRLDFAIGIKHGIGEVGMKAGHDPGNIIYHKNLNRNHRSRIFDDSNHAILKSATGKHYEFYKNLI